MPFGQFSIPGFNPYAPAFRIPGGTPPIVDPGVSGMPEEPEQPQGLLSMFDPRTPGGNQTLLNLGAGLLAGSGSGQGFGAIAGQALQGALAQRQQSIDNDLQRVLLKAKIKQAQQGEKTAGIQEYEYAKANGYQGSFQDWQRDNRGQASQAAPPASIQEYNKAVEQGYKGTFQEFVGEISKARVGAPFVQGEMGGARGGFNRTDNTFNGLTTAEQEELAALRRAAAEASGAAGGKIDTERGATFQQDLGVIDDEILRTQRLLTEFKEGKYQTGPLAGRLPSMRDAAQNLEREQGRDVLKNISQATFGALSEGERAFIAGIGLDPKKNEGSNVTYLEERLAALQNAKKRLQTRPPAGPVQPSGSSPPSRPPLSSFRK